MAKSATLLAVACLVGTASSRSVAPAPSSTAPAEAEPAKKTERGGRLSTPVVIGGVGGVALLAIPPARRAVVSGIQKLLNRDGALGEPPPSYRRSKAAEAAADGGGDDGAAPASESESASGMPSTSRPGQQEAEQFALTPERLATIAELNPKLEQIGPQLMTVPVFTAAVGNGTSPLTVPTDNGRKLAYFFTERSDAEAFLRAVRSNSGVELDAQVIGVSLADIVHAYSLPAAVEANETYVLIPTMAEVAAARHLLHLAGKEEPDPSVLGPGTGLIPVFWSEHLAVQTASGKQRKVLFLRLGDLHTMWQNLSDARKASGELDELPDGPTVMVSSLQMMAGILTDANKTDEVMFLPSSNALRQAQEHGDLPDVLRRGGAAAAGGGGGGAPLDSGGAATEANLGDELGDGGFGEADDDDDEAGGYV